MATLLAESVPHRARFAWLGAALVASIAAFVLTRPAKPEPREPVSFARPACVEHYLGGTRVDVVPSYSSVDGMPVYK